MNHYRQRIQWRPCWHAWHPCFGRHLLYQRMAISRPHLCLGPRWPCSPEWSWQPEQGKCSINWINKITICNPRTISYNYLYIYYYYIFISYEECNPIIIIMINVTPVTIVSTWNLHNKWITSLKMKNSCKTIYILTRLVSLLSEILWWLFLPMAVLSFYLLPLQSCSWKWKIKSIFTHWIHCLFYQCYSCWVLAR